MATLKEHQAAMVDLLANGSGIPASASRLAHAMHDTLRYLNGDWDEAVRRERLDRPDATTPGLNDKALSKPQKALKTDSPAKWPTPAEQRVKELENTIRQLKANNAKLKADYTSIQADRDELQSMLYNAREELRAWGSCSVQEQAGCRKEDTQVCEHEFSWDSVNTCLKCGAPRKNNVVAPDDNSWDTDRRPGGDGVGVGE